MKFYLFIVAAIPVLIVMCGIFCIQYRHYVTIKLITAFPLFSEFVQSLFRGTKPSPVFIGCCAGGFSTTWPVVQVPSFKHQNRSCHLLNKNPDNETSGTNPLTESFGLKWGMYTEYHTFDPDMIIFHNIFASPVRNLKKTKKTDSHFKHIHAKLKDERCFLCSLFIEKTAAELNEKASYISDIIHAYTGSTFSELKKMLRVHYIRSKIDNGAYQGNSIELISDECNCSRMTLNRHFKNYLGITLAEYIKRERHKKPYKRSRR